MTSPQREILSSTCVSPSSVGKTCPTRCDLILNEICLAKVHAPTPIGLEFHLTHGFPSSPDFSEVHCLRFFKAYNLAHSSWKSVPHRFSRTLMKCKGTWDNWIFLWFMMHLMIISCHIWISPVVYGLNIIRFDG